MENILFTTQQFEPFTSSWGVEASIISYNHNGVNGFIIPLGWEDELTKRNITFEIIELEL